MQSLERQLEGSCPALVQMVTQCLHNIPSVRPSSPNLLQRLQVLKAEIEAKFGGITGTQLNISSVLLLKELKVKDKIISQLQVASGIIY